MVSFNPVEFFTQLTSFQGVSVKCGPDGGGWRMADRKMRMIKCGWEITDDKMRMEKCGWKKCG